MKCSPPEVLRSLLVQYGRSLCDNPPRLKGLLRDYLGVEIQAHESRINVLILALQHGIVEYMLEATDQLPPAMLQAQAARRLCAELAMNEEAAQWAVSVWGFALGLWPTIVPEAAWPHPPATPLQGHASTVKLNRPAPTTVVVPPAPAAPAPPSRRKRRRRGLLVLALVSILGALAATWQRDFLQDFAHSWKEAPSISSSSSTISLAEDETPKPAPSTPVLVEDAIPKPQRPRGRGPALRLEAQTLLKQGRFREARAACQTALDSEPSLPGIWTTRAEAHLGLRQLGEARTDCDTALKKDPKCVEALEVRARVGLSQSQVPQARDDAGSAIAQQPSFAAAHATLARCCLAAAEYDEAIDHASKALELDLANAAAWRCKIEAQTQTGRRAAALRTCEEALTAVRAVAPADFRARAWLQVRLERHEAALSDLRRALEGNAEQPAVLAEMAQVFLDLGNAAEALSYAEKTVRSAPSWTAGYRLWSSALRRSGHPADSFEKDGEALGLLHPAEPHEYAERAWFHEDREEYAAALEDYSNALAGLPSSAVIYRARAQLYLLERQPQKALEDYRRAIELAPRAAEGYLGRGQANLAQRHYDAAQADFEKALQCNPSCAEAALRLAQRLRAKKNKDGATRILDQGLATLVDARLTEDFVFRGRLLASRGDHDQAIADFTRAIERSPKDPTALIQRAKVYRTKKEYSNAVEDCKRALHLDPHRYEVRQMLSNVLSDAGKKDEQKGILLGCIACIDDPRRPSEYYWRAWFRNEHAQEGDFDAALEDCSRAIALRPRYLDAHEERRYVLDKKGNRNELIDTLGVLVQLAPDSANYRNQRGNQYLVRGDLSEALEDYSAAIRLDPNKADYYVNRAKTYQKLSQPREAAVDYRECLRRDRNNRDAAKALTELTLQGVRKILPDDSLAVFTLNLRQGLAAPVVKAEWKEKIHAAMMSEETVKSLLSQLGFDPLRDTDRLTLAVVGTAPDVVGIMQGTWDTQRFHAALRADSSFTREEVSLRGGRSAARAEEEKIFYRNSSGTNANRLFVALLQGDVVLTSSRELMIETLEKNGGDRKVEWKDRRLQELLNRADPQQTLFGCGLLDTFGKGSNPLQDQIALMCGHITLAADAQLELLITAKDEDSAAKLQESWQGMLRILEQQKAPGGAEEAAVAALTKSLKTFTVSQQRGTVTLKGKIAAEDFHSIIEAVIAASKKPAAAPAGERIKPSSSP